MEDGIIFTENKSLSELFSNGFAQNVLSDDKKNFEKYVNLEHDDNENDMELTYFSNWNDGVMQTIFTFPKDFGNDIMNSYFKNNNVYTRLRNGAYPPVKGKPGDSAFDLRAHFFPDLKENQQLFEKTIQYYPKSRFVQDQKTGQISVIIPPGGTCIIPTGLAFGMPKGYGSKLLTKSSSASKLGMSVKGGVIDPNYTGEIFVIIKNEKIPHPDDYTVGFLEIKEGDKICQVEFALNHQDILYEIPYSIYYDNYISKSVRKDGKFGSTGN